MTIDKENIRAAAMAANTHGAWKIGAMESGMYAVDDADNCEVTGWIEPEVALHIIASDPSTVLALLDALDKAEKDSEWQPIETAPRNATRILINSERRGVREAKFLGGNAEVGLCFYDTMVGGGPMTIFYDTTHWKPLPAPPAIEQAKGGME